MKFIIFPLILSSFLILSGCGSRNQELELLREQNALLQEQLEYFNKSDKDIVIESDTFDEVSSNVDSEKSISATQVVQKPTVANPNISQSSTSLREDDFYKRIDCSKYQSAVEGDHPLSLVNIFFSPVKNTCVAKVVYISPRSGGMIYDILGNDFYAVIGIDGVMTYDESVFGPNQTLVSIESQLK